MFLSISATCNFILVRHASIRRRRNCRGLTLPPLRLFDHDDFGRDDLIGSFKLQMTDLAHADKSEAIKVRNKDGDEVIGEDGTPCVISISTKFSPHADKAAIALTKSIYEPDAVSVLP